ncbi:unnamed protein product, partial [Nesidiocoris tenuis]
MYDWAENNKPAFRDERSVKNGSNVLNILINYLIKRVMRQSHVVRFIIPPPLIITVHSRAKP